METTPNRELTLYKNSADIKRKNTRVTVLEMEDNSFMIDFRFADKDPDKPAVNHQCLKNKVRVSQIFLSEEAVQDIVIAYNEYLRNKLNTNP